MRRLYFAIILGALLLSGCVNKGFDDISNAKSDITFEVGDFVQFGASQTRIIGTPDIGKTAWDVGDKLLVVTDAGSSTTLTYTADYKWVADCTLGGLNEQSEIAVTYAPNCALTAGVITPQESLPLGTGEYYTTEATLSGNTVTISFADAARTYSRLRIAGLENQTLTVTTTGFTPAGATEVATAAYTLTTDNNGNAFLYGVFAEGATVSVKQGDITLKDYTFTAEKNPNGTEYNKSYALDATPVIDGTLGGKDTAEESDITALVEQLKAYVDNGITTIIVPGSEPALIEMDSWTNTVIGEAIYRLSKEESYNGKIDLILPDVTEIFDQEFHSARALNSITLAKVTKLADQAFYGTLYLRTITFGSVITEVNELGAIFNQVGYKVGGCDLILNCGQMNESNVPAPDLTNNIWKFKFENEFKSITLTHTDECGH
ncbi:MAG: hypothetical protein IJX65_09965 [Alistipes sp.]|nr:hypothetical protein [Alistipes sp.]